MNHFYCLKCGSLVMFADIPGGEERSKAYFAELKEAGVCVRCQPVKVKEKYLN